MWLKLTKMSYLKIKKCGTDVLFMLVRRASRKEVQ
jgi:hypothetical protein